MHLLGDGNVHVLCLALTLSTLLGCASTGGSASGPAASHPALDDPAAQKAPSAPLPPPTAKGAPCPIEQLRQDYLSGRWKEGELLAQRCLEQDPLSTEARVLLVRMYIMRAYAAREPRWLDEARRQLKMVAADPAYDAEARELSLLIEHPTIE